MSGMFAKSFITPIEKMSTDEFSFSILCATKKAMLFFLVYPVLRTLSLDATAWAGAAQTCSNFILRQ